MNLLRYFGQATDALLDEIIPLSYSRPGYWLRSLGWRDGLTSVDMRGKSVLITGANAGLGLATSALLAQMGATVHMVARNAEKGQRAQTAVATRTQNDQVYLHVVDLSDLTAVAQFAHHFRQEQSRLDVLIHNASVLLNERQTSVDGHEKTLATNLLTPFLLTQELLPLLKASAPARVITVSSGGMYSQKLDVDDLQTAHKPYDGTMVYAQTKRAQVILTELWAEKHADSGVTFNACHPGWVNTPGVQTSLPNFYKVTRPFLQTPKQGADTMVWLASAPQIEQETGQFWYGRRPRSTHKIYLNTQNTNAERQQLWKKCNQIVNSQVK